MENEFKKVTVRGRGKCHRALVGTNGWTVAACSCPGSMNGSLVKKCTFVCEGWEKANCETREGLKS